ncbi:integrase [Spinactinospora alkalitolerans]|uniref:Integrase n=1 Tax=Spinactinospora alkalitolerans TaxID=687207 RepID=A0A852TXC5_9ACTN|nr:bifunctional DNA primase/polymerase [Spinactinospora alkalitolerans]NYE46694.1 integrase [Spinactinospora alkalitolerans]
MTAFAPVDYALAALRRGWSVFPITPGAKQPPLVRDWNNAATREPEQVRAWWEQWPEANYGIATGPSGLVVIDLDTPKPGRARPPAWDQPGITDGADVLAALAEDAGQRSPLAGTPYALRHTCVSTWLNAGVSETLVARWAGHSVAVLKKIYAKCLVGEEERAKQQIEEALRRG